MIQRMCITFCLWAVLFSGCSIEKVGTAKSVYMGQPLPGDTPEVFAPGLVCTDLYERDVAMTPDNSEMYFGVIAGQLSYATIACTRRNGSTWTKPAVAWFCREPNVKDLEPHITPDGNRFLFVSNRDPDDHTEACENWDIWVMDRTEQGWGRPYNAGPNVNTAKGEYFPSVTQNGTLYFTRDEPGGDGIYRSRFIDGAYAPAERLPEAVNLGRTRYNAFVSPREDYLIVPAVGAEPCFGGTDYYILFRTPDDRWSKPMNMGPRINSASGLEWSAWVSPDEEYIFFMSVREPAAEHSDTEELTMKRLVSRQRSVNNGNPNIFWMRAGIIDSLRSQAVFK